jgi:TonB family protein
MLRNKVKSSQLINEYWWQTCAAISVLLHIVLFSTLILIPVKSTHKSSGIEVFVVREADLAHSVEAKPKKIKRPFIRQPASIPNVLQQVPVRPPSAQSQLAKKKEEPGSSGTGNIINGSAIARVVAGTETGNGVAIGGAGFGGTKAGGAGTGGGGIGGKGAGSGEGNGSGYLETGFGRPDGPQFLHREIPEYPFTARRLHKEGRVVLMVFIDEKGKLLKVEVVKASDQEFAESAVEAVKRSTFLPARKKGVPVAARAVLPIRFALQ